MQQLLTLCSGAFGFLFDFKGNANNTIVRPVKDAIQEQWFKDAISDKEVDLFLVRITKARKHTVPKVSDRDWRCSEAL